MAHATCLQRGRAPAARCARKKSAESCGIFARIARVRVDFARFLRPERAPRPPNACISDFWMLNCTFDMSAARTCACCAVRAQKVGRKPRTFSQKSRASALILRGFCVQNTRRDSTMRAEVTPARCTARATRLQRERPPARDRFALVSMENRASLLAILHDFGAEFACVDLKVH